MFIPPSQSPASQPVKPLEGVSMESKHLCFGSELAAEVFGESENAFLALYPEKGYLAIASVTQQFFKKVHDAAQVMLKRKNLDGARSIALHEWLIDHDLQIPSGPLRYEFRDTTGILKVWIP